MTLSACSTKYAFATKDDMEIQQQIHDFLDSCLESGEVKTYMLQVIASALYGRNVRERFFVFKGTSGNGEHLVCFPRVLGAQLPNNLCSQPNASSATVSPSSEFVRACVCVRDGGK